RKTATPVGPGWRFRFAVDVAASDARDVLRRGALGALDHVELDAVAFGQRLEPAALDGAVMDEAVLRAVLARDEPEALGLVEPLHGSPGTHSLLLFVPGVIGVRRTRTDRAPVLRGLHAPAVLGVAVRITQRKRTRTMSAQVLALLVPGLRAGVRSPDEPSI